MTPGRAKQLRVLVERLDAVVDAEAVFDCLYRDSEYAFWLDSATAGVMSGGLGGPDGRMGECSFLGDTSGPLARVACADVWAGTVRVTSADGVQLVESGFFDWLERDLAEQHVDVPELPFGFTLGWVGYLGYELKAECGGSRAHRAGTPDAVMLFVDRAVVIDHRTGTGYLLALASVSDDSEARSWLADTAGLLASRAGRPPADEPGEPPEVGEVTARHGCAQYLGMIARCQQEIVAGESYEVCLTNMVTARARLDPWSGYRKLRRLSPVPFAALLRCGELTVLSASPERFLKISADGVVESRPIKGTRPRGETARHDEFLRRDLARSTKDLAENLMIVDLVRNDLSRCAEVGSVSVPRIFEVETYATVHQLVSTVRARLRAGVSPVRCVQTAFPGGSMTGAPKVRTMEIIDELERGPRGVYSGAIGFFSLSGAVDLSIVIRTLVVGPEQVSFGVGGAIIAPSDPVAEFEETVVKATPMLRLLGVAFPRENAERQREENS